MSAQAFSMVITPNWPAPMRVRAASTERKGGASEGPYTSQHLGLHVGDDAEVVISNRRALMEALGLVKQLEANC